MAKLSNYNMYPFHIITWSEFYKLNMLMSSINYYSIKKVQYVHLYTQVDETE